MKGGIVKAVREHAIQMAPRLRFDEVRELADSHGLDPEAAILAELDKSVVAWSWIVGGEVACMFGIVEIQGDARSYPWFLSSGMVNENAFEFARACKQLLPELLSRHPHLVGMVDARYHLSVRWLKWLGAEVGKPEPWGVAQKEFCRFEIGR